ncbi:B12-binding domain-containing radical SAM protein [Chloroflexota bacterium]
MNNKRNIVLYEPFFWGSRRPVERAPLNLMAVASVLDQEGYDISIVSHSLDDEPEKKVLEDCRDAICFGITSLTGFQIVNGLNMAKQVRDRYPDLPIVWGGWHPTLEPETTLASPYVDIILRGQAERTFKEVVHALESGGSLEDISGVSYKQDGAAYHNPMKPLEDINNFPPLPYHLINVERVLSSDEYGRRVINYISSYGCPYKCAFCAEWGVHDMKWSGLSAQRMADDFERLVRDYNVDCISVNDTQFCIQKGRVKELAEELLKRNIDVKWGGINGNIRPLLGWEDEMWELMYRAGCRSIAVGAESGFPDALELMAKGVSVEETLSFAKKTSDFDIKVLFSIMVGLPWDKDIKRTRQLIDEEIRLSLDLTGKIIDVSDKHRVSYATFTPYPGTPLYERAVSLGLEKPTSLEEWSNWISGRHITPWLLPRQINKVNFVTSYVLLFLDSDAYHWVPERIGNKMGRLLFKGVYRVFIQIAKFRWKHRFFALPLDYWIYRWGRKMLGII